MRAYYDRIVPLLGTIDSLRQYECLLAAAKSFFVQSIQTYTVLDLLSIAREIALMSPEHTTEMQQTFPMLVFLREEVKRGILQAQTENLDSIRVSSQCKRMYKSVVEGKSSPTISLLELITLLLEEKELAVDILSQIRTEFPVGALLEWTVLLYINLFGYSVTPEMKDRIMRVAMELFVDPLPVARVAGEALGCTNRRRGREKGRRRVMFEL